MRTLPHLIERRLSPLSTLNAYDLLNGWLYLTHVYRARDIVGTLIDSRYSRYTSLICRRRLKSPPCRHLPFSSDSTEVVCGDRADLGRQVLRQSRRVAH